ncbi:XRE family transcriptional regulator [Hymenobacter rubripertinctus]|uniref:XRE family transcriptional regulator n=1 Tax=Hymenobacter rubripertinctus TaxID=2029981 RepID=A0A418QT21_9BACT|nr:XRE family transcriptional regulator [Hymenobacter rubripertinctus]
MTGRQLARYLGVTPGFVHHLETGRRSLSARLAPRLVALSRLLPPPLGQGPPVAPEPDFYDPLAPLPLPEQLLGSTAPTAAVAPDALHQRVRDTRLLLLVLGQRLARQQQQAAAMARRRRGLTQLRASAAPADAAEAAHYTKWLAGLTLDLELDEPEPAATTTTRWLLAARVAGLRAEVAALKANQIL